MAKARTAAEVIAAEATRGEFGSADIEAISHVVANRARAMGVSPDQVVSVKAEFNAYDTLDKPPDRLVDAAQAALDAAMAGALDPTNGALSYAMPGYDTGIPGQTLSHQVPTGHNYYTIEPGPEKTIRANINGKITSVAVDFEKVTYSDTAVAALDPVTQSIISAVGDGLPPELTAALEELVTEEIQVAGLPRAKPDPVIDYSQIPGFDIIEPLGSPNIITAGISSPPVEPMDVAMTDSQLTDLAAPTQSKEMGFAGSPEIGRAIAPTQSADMGFSGSPELAHRAAGARDLAVDIPRSAPPRPDISAMGTILDSVGSAPSGIVTRAQLEPVREPIALKGSVTGFGGPPGARASVNMVAPTASGLSRSKPDDMMGFAGSPEVGSQRAPGLPDVSDMDSIMETLADFGIDMSSMADSPEMSSRSISAPSTPRSRPNDSFSTGGVGGGQGGGGGGGIPGVELEGASVSSGGPRGFSGSFKTAPSAPGLGSSTPNEDLEAIRDYSNLGQMPTAPGLSSTAADIMAFGVPDASFASGVPAPSVTAPQAPKAPAPVATRAPTNILKKGWATKPKPINPVIKAIAAAVPKIGIPLMGINYIANRVGNQVPGAGKSRSFGLSDPITDAADQSYNKDGSFNLDGFYSKAFEGPHGAQTYATRVAYEGAKRTAVQRGVGDLYGLSPAKSGVSSTRSVSSKSSRESSRNESSNDRGRNASSRSTRRERDLYEDRGGTGRESSAGRGW